MITETTFWSIVGIIGAALGGLFLLLLNTNIKLSNVATGLEQLVKTLDKFLEDRKEKDRDYYQWKEKVDEVKLQHGMMVNAKKMIEHHDTAPQ